MPTVLITGANRGLGLEFTRQYMADGWNVIATARGDAPDLAELGVRIETLDMSNLDQVAAFGDRLNEPLDLLIANAGTYGPRSATTSAEGRDWADTLTVNAIAPFLLAQSVLPRVRAAGGKLIAISSRMGSIADNDSGGFLAYRSSKTALNSAWKVLSVDNRDIVCAVLHPGWVKTRMGGPSALLAPKDSIAGMRRVIAGLGPAQSGGFFNYDGAAVPW